MKTVEKIEKTREDRNGRTLTHVYVGNVSVNKKLLRLVMVSHYKYYQKDQELSKLEDEAKAANAGLWPQVNSVAPCDFGGKLSNFVSLIGDIRIESVKYKL